MDSNLDLPSTDAKAAFSKPPAVNRNYRRRPAVSGSSESAGSPEHNDNSSPKVSRDGSEKVSEHQPRRKYDDRDIKRDLERSFSGRSYDSYKHSYRQSRNSNDYHRDGDYNKADKHANDEEGSYQILSSRSSRGSRGGAQYDHVRSREPSRYLDKHSHDKYDGSGHWSKDKDRGSKFLENQRYKDDSLSEKVGSAGIHGHFEEVERVRDGHTVDRDSQVERRDFRSKDYRSERNLSYEESKRHRSDSKHEGCKSDLKEMDHENVARDQRKKYDDTDTRRRKDQIIKEPTEGSKSEDICRGQDHDSAAKRPKLHNLDKGIAGRRVSMFTTTSDGRESSSSNQVLDGTMTRGKTEANHAEVSNDLNAAKVAAMKAAELVNRNLAGVGPGCMTAEQKKKLLWGNKKNTTAEEGGHRWDTALFPDRERREKFKKLMSLRLPWCLWPIVGCEGRSKVGAPSRQPRREAEGTPAGFGEAVHGWTAKKRWTHCWFGSLSIVRLYCTGEDIWILCSTLVQELCLFLFLGLTWNMPCMDLSFNFLNVYNASEPVFSFVCACDCIVNLNFLDLAGINFHCSTHYA